MRVLARSLRRAALVALVLVAGACAEPATQAPAPATDSDAAPPDAVARLFYMTDRNPEDATPVRSIYGMQRSASMAFGVLSPVAGRNRAATLSAREIVRFPRTPLPFSQQGGRIVPDPPGEAAYAEQSRRFQADMAAVLRGAGRRDVTVFVHGVANDFAQAVETGQVLWDASGGAGVLLVFSWPASRAGLTGYLRDTESGEFSVFHLKETLRLLAGVPGLDAIHVIAHSRGADVATTALREMVIAARAAGRLPRDVMKIDNLILAAPDLDFGVVSQRLIAERFGPAFGRISVYMNPRDGTLALSQSLLSGTRFGRLTLAQMAENEREVFRRIRNVDFIDVENVVMRSGHGYFRQNPAVLDDIGTLLRDSPPPEDPRRFLRPVGVNFWVIVNPPRAAGMTGPRGGEAR